MQDPTEELETVGSEPAPQPSVKERPESGVSLLNLFRHRDAHPFVLDVLLLRRYGIEWLGWEPETLERHVNQDFRGGISEINLAKVQAMKALHRVDTFWQQWEVFVWCLMPLNGVLPDFEVMQVPTVAQCLVAVDIANRVRDDVEWSGEIKAYLEVVHRHDGIFCPQAPLEFVTVDTEGLPIQCACVSEAWPQVRASGKAPAEESVTAEQLRRLLVAFNYLEESRSRLRQQLPLASHA